MTGKIEARPAAEADRPIIERLIQLYLHDMTEFNPFPIGPDGLYENGMLDRFWERPYLIYSDGEIAGFALVIGHCPVTHRSHRDYDGEHWLVYEFES
jgi:predicted acetyltransferase